MSRASKESKQQRVWAGVVGGCWGTCVSSERTERGFGGRGLNRSECPSTCVFIRPLVLVYLMFHPQPSRSQYSVLARVRVGKFFSELHVKFLAPVNPGAHAHIEQHLHNFHLLLGAYWSAEGLFTFS